MQFSGLHPARTHAHSRAYSDRALTTRTRLLRDELSRYTVLRRLVRAGAGSDQTLKLTLDCCAICLMDGVSLGATALFEAGHPLTSRARAARHASVHSTAQASLCTDSDLPMTSIPVRRSLSACETRCGRVEASQYRSNRLCGRVEASLLES